MSSLIRCEVYINGFRETIVAVIARKHLRALNQSLAMRLTDDRHHLWLLHQPQRRQIDSLIVT